MKLAIVRQICNPNGGAERFVFRTLNILAQNTDLDVTLISRQRVNINNWKTLTVNPPFHNRITRDLGFAIEAADYFAQFDIVQSHERIPGATIFRAGDGVHATWLKQCARTLSPLTSWIQLFNRYHRYILQTEARMFTHPQLRTVICNSKMVRDDIARRFSIPDNRLTVIYNGVDTSYFNPHVRIQSQRTVLGIPQDAPVLAYVGSGFNRKGVAVALQSIAPHPIVWLIIAGWDKNARKFKKLAEKLGISSRVRFLGKVADVRQIYGTADALILPTLYDPFPNVCIEALACSLPLFTSYSCGAAELIKEGQNGWVRDALDTVGYQQAITAWLKGREQGVDYSTVARAAVEDYTIDHMVKKLQTLYYDLLS